MIYFVDGFFSYSELMAGGGGVHMLVADAGMYVACGEPHE